MTVQEVVLKALSGGAALVSRRGDSGWSPRTLRRWRKRFETHGHSGLIDRRLLRPSKRRVPPAQLELVLRLYRERWARDETPLRETLAGGIDLQGESKLLIDIATQKADGHLVIARLQAKSPGCPSSPFHDGVALRGHAGFIALLARLRQERDRWQ
jgi:hypothetical protein